MGKVYRVGNHHGTIYCNTVKDADRCNPGGEQPESVICVDAAGECNRLERYMEETERTCNALRMML